MIKVMIGKEEYLIKGEKTQWTLGQMKLSTNKKTGKEYMRFDGEAYYSCLEALLKSLLDKKLRAEDHNSLTGLKLSLEKAKDELKGYYDTEVTND